MDEWPKMVVCLLTYKRTQYALQTVKQFIPNVEYEPEKILWYIADDGSPKEHVDAIEAAIKQQGQKIIGMHNERLQPGPSWTRAAKEGLKHADYIFWLEDDWVPRERIGLKPYVQMLHERPDVGMVRLGHMAVGLLMESVGHDGRHYMDILKSRQYCYSGNPSIRHRRHFDAYGYYPSDPRGPGDCEIYHDDLVRSKDGPRVWWPVDIGGWGAFGHIGTNQSYQ